MTGTCLDTERERHEPADAVWPRPHLVTNPADDEEFRDFALLSLSPGLRPAALQAILRERYPHAVVHPRGIAGEVLVVWYVYRDGYWVGRGRDHVGR